MLFINNMDKYINMLLLYYLIFRITSSIDLKNDVKRSLQ